MGVQNLNECNDIMPLDVKHDKSGTTPLDTRVKHEYDRRIESGRSMVEMLGVLAIMGVLSIGGIMGYSYAMDRWRANQTMRDINLRSVDVLMQYENTGDANLDAWANDKTIYPISLEDETIGIQVDGVPQRVCEMMADGMADIVFAIKLNGTFIEEVPVDCAPENAMVFYFTGDEEENEDTNTGTGDNTPIPCPEELPTDVLFFTCEYDGIPIVCIMGQCGADATVFCEMEGITDCPVDKGCTVLMDDASTLFPIVGQECQKDGVFGRCDTNGKCILEEPSDEPVICGGVNCVEYIEEFFATIPEDERVLMGMVISAPPKECITCVNDMCSVGEMGQGLCAVDGIKVCMDGGENLSICLAPQTCTGFADCGECHECIDGACQPVGGACTTADGEQGVCSAAASCLSCSAEGGIYVGTDAPCEEVCPNRYKDGSSCHPKCGTGIYADKPLTDSSHKCHACSEEEGIYVSDKPCSEVCSNRYKDGSYCYHSCGVGIYAGKPLMDDYEKCHECSEEGRIYVSNKPCSEVCSDRYKDGSYCYPKCGEGIYADKPLMDSNGKCHACSEEERITVGADNPCSEVCSNRYKDGSYCYHSCGEGIYAGKPLRDTSGNCYACDDESKVQIRVFLSSTYLPCEGICPKRQQQGNYCYYCPPEKPLLAGLDDNGPNCHSCTEEGRVYVGTDDRCSEACSNRYKHGNYCYYCPPDKPLMDLDGTCHACDDESIVEIHGSLSSDYLPCEAVCSKRQQKDGYCYYCPPDKPLVDSNGGCHACSEEEDVAQGPYPNLLCSEVCPNRVKTNYFCKLK